MKVRYGFVTNSSSSSFIIALKKENGELPKDIEELLLEWAKEQILCGGETISTIEELEEFIIDEYGYKNQTLEEVLNDDEYAKKRYDKWKTLIEDGYIVYKKWISCEGQDEHLTMYSDAIDKLEKSKNFVGIDTDMYY